MMNHVVRRGRRTRPLSLRLLLCAFSLFIVSNVDSADSQERPPAIDRTDSGRETLDLLASKGALIYPATKPNGTVSVSLLRPGDDDAFWRGSDADMALLARLPYVAVLHMNCTIKDQKALRFLAQMPALKRLVDTGCSIRDDGMEYVARCSRLEEFEALTSISDVGLRRLISMKSLRKLKLWSHHVTDKGLDGIDAHSSIEVLELACPEITDRGLEKIVKLPRLRELSVAGTNVSEAGVDMLAKCHGLVWLSVTGSKITGAGVQKLKGALPHCVIDSCDKKHDSRPEKIKGKEENQ